MGPDLMAAMRAQAQRFAGEIVSADVDTVEFTTASPFTFTVGGDAYRARTAIIATGATARWLGLDNEQRLIGRGVSACATCDGFFFRDKQLVVVGGGDSAMEEAAFLTKFASNVTVVHRRDELRCSKIMQNRAFDNDKIDFIWCAEVVDITGEDVVTGVVLRDTRTGARTEFATDGVFLAIGHDPTTTMFRGQLQLNAQGYIVVTEPTTATSVPGLFAAGDVVDHTYRQAITAAAMGCKAAIDAERFLSIDAENFSRTIAVLPCQPDLMSVRDLPPMPPRYGT